MKNVLPGLNPSMVYSFLFSLTFISCSFSSKTTKRLLEESAEKKYDIVIVPGIPFDSVQWDRVMKGRVYWSKYQYDRGITKNVMYSGSAVYTPYYEAEIMAMYAEAIGIPKEHIFTETKAEHSTENIYYGYKKAKKLGFTKIALASDPFQTKMLRSYTHKRLGRDVGIIPFVVDTLEKMQPMMIDPTIDFQKAYLENFVPITSREGFWKRFRGTLGKNVDENAYQ